MTRMTGPDCAVVCNLIVHVRTHIAKSMLRSQPLLGDLGTSTKKSSKRFFCLWNRGKLPVLSGTPEMKAWLGKAAANPTKVDHTSASPLVPQAPPSQHLERRRVPRGDGREQKQNLQEIWRQSIPAPTPPPLPRPRSDSHEGDQGSNNNDGVGGEGILDRQPPPRQDGSPVDSLKGSVAKAAGLGRRRVRGGARRRGTRAAAIDGPRSNAGGGDGGEQRHPLSFCTVPLPAEGVVDEEEDVESRHAADVRHDLEVGG